MELSHVSPLQRLPTELIVEVFLTCVNLFDVPPERFCHIDRRLRYISLGTPELWATVIYHGLPQEEPRLLMFFELSATMPITMRLCLTRRFLSDAPSYNRLFETIEPHLTRIRSLSVATREGFDLEALDATHRDGSMDFESVYLRLALFEQYLPALEDIDLELPGFEMLPVMMLAGHAPLLRNISIKSVDFIDVKTVVMRSRVVRTLKIILPTLPTLDLARGLLDALDGLPDLTDLTVELPGQAPNWTYTEVPDTYRRLLPRLEHLRLHLRSFACLGLIECPLLRCISVQGGDTDEVDGHLRTFLEIHSTSIISLNVTFVDQTIERRRNDVPHLTPIEFPKLTKFTSFARNSRELMLLQLIGGPVLHEISLCVAYDYETPVDGIVQFLERVSASVSSFNISIPLSEYSPDWNPRKNAVPENTTLIFPRLEHFTWDCRLGDIVFAYIKEAPRLKCVQLRGDLDYNVGSSLEENIQNHDIVLPGLETMLLMEYSAVMWRIHSPALTGLIVRAVLMDVNHSELGDLNRSFVWKNAHRAVYRLIVAHAQSLEALILCEPLLPNIPLDLETVPPVEAPHPHIFPRLRAVSLVQGDDTAEWITAPNLQVLEFRNPGTGSEGRLQSWPLRSLQGFVNAHTLRIKTLLSLNLRKSPELREFWCLDRVRHLHIDVYTDACGGEIRESKLLLPEFDFLRKLSQTVPPISTELPDDNIHHDHRPLWVFPQLATVHIRLVSAGFTDELNRAWFPDAVPVPEGDNSAGSDLGGGAQTDNNEAETTGFDIALDSDASDSDVYNGSSCPDSSAGSARIEWLVEQHAPALLGTDKDEGKDGDESDVSEYEYGVDPPSMYDLRKRNRALFVRLLQSFKDLVVARNTCTPGTDTALGTVCDRDADPATSPAAITSLTLSTDGEFRCNWSIPSDMQDYFDGMSVVLAVDATQD